jgi:hypothetical protein
LIGRLRRQLRHHVENLALWFTVIVTATFIVYPLSFGAVLLLDWWGVLPGSSYETLRLIYAPFVWVVLHWPG